MFQKIPLGSNLDITLSADELGLAISDIEDLTIVSFEGLDFGDDPLRASALAIPKVLSPNQKSDSLDYMDANADLRILI